MGAGSSQRVHSNIALSFSRCFNQNAFGTNTAVPTTAPGSLVIPDGSGNTGHSKLNAHGIAGNSGLISFMTEQASQPYTLWIWSEMSFKLTGNGWVKNGAVAAEYTKTVDQYAKASFTISEGDLFFIQAGTSACRYLFLAGCSRYNASPFADSPIPGV